jgi:hypothetical protein
MFYVSVFSIFINKFHSLLNTIMFSEQRAIEQGRQEVVRGG